MKKIDRTGEIKTSKFGSVMKIVQYNDCHDILVEFQDEYKAVVHSFYSLFQKRNIVNPFQKTVGNVGYLGSSEITVMQNGKVSKSYETWRNMVVRCYDENKQKLQPTYKDCTVCVEWHSFYNFNEWYKNNYYSIDDEPMHIDKDILIKGNKIYSPETCVFVPLRMNSLFAKANARRGKYPIGVTYNLEHHNNYIARCENGSGQPIHIGGYNNALDAFYAYKIYKEQLIKEVADEYKDKIPQILYDALYRYEVEITD